MVYALKPCLSVMQGGGRGTVFHMGKVSQSGLVQRINPAVCIHLFPQRDNDQHGTALDEERKREAKLS